MRISARRSRRVLVALLAGAVGAGLTLTGSVVPAQAVNGTVTGTVTEAGTGSPLGGVTVEAFCWVVSGTDPGTSCGATETAPDGTYSLSLLPGVYKVSYDDVPAHARQFFGGGTDIGDADASEVPVPNGGTVTGIDAALLPLRTVAGTVTGAGGPLGNINVRAYQLGDGPSPGWESVTGVVTGPDGSYALHLVEGTYRVGFSDAHGPFATEFYDDAATVDDADDVVVAGDVAGIDADLARNSPITGLVTLDGINMPQVTVTAYQASGPGAWDAVKVTETGEDGRYTLYVPDGSYRIQFTTWQGRFPSVFYPGVATIEQASDVVVAGAEVPGINAIIVSDTNTGPAIRGTVTLADGGPAPFVIVTAWRFDVDFGSWVRVRSRATGPDGTYAVYVPEGTYRIAFADGSTQYQTVFYDGAATVDDATDVVLPTEGVSGIDGEVVENNSISGQVTADPLPDGPLGPPPTLVTAYRWDDATLDWVQAGEAGSGPDGRYQLFAPDGTYRIKFTDFSGFYEQPYFFDGADSIGEAIDVVLDGSDVTGVDAHLVLADDEPPPTWGPSTTLSGPGGDAWAPAIAVSPRGTAFAVWSDRGHGRLQASSRARGAAAWTAPSFMSPAGQDAFDPRVAIGSDGTLVVVWRQWDGTHYRVEAKARSATGAWSPPVTLSGPDADGWDAQVAVSRGRALAVWRSSDGTTSRVQASTLDDGTWSAPRTLSGDQDAWDPQAALAPDGTGAVVWSRAGAAHVRVLAVRLSADGDWSRRRYLSARGRDADDPQVAVARRGAATVVWRGSDGSEERIQVVRREPHRPWTDPRYLSKAGRDAHDPQVAMDTSGAATAVWSRWDGSTDRVQASSKVPGQRWTAPETLSAGGEDATDPQVVAAADGQVTAVWRNATDFNETVLAAIRPAGWTWSPPTVLTPSPDGEAGITVRGPRVAVGKDGSVAAVWERRFGGNDRVEGVLRVDPGGSGHCRNQYGVDLNVVFGVAQPFLDPPCQSVDAGSRWRPLTLWVVNTAFEQVPPDFLPAGASPLEDLIAKLASVTVVVDAGTDDERSVEFSPGQALRTDKTLSDYNPSEASWPMPATLPKMADLPIGHHTVTVVWELSAQHCDGFGVVEAENCLSGRVPMWTRDLTVTR